MLIQDLKSFRVPPGFRGRSAIVVQIWWIVQATVFSWSPQPFFGWRAFLLRLFGASIGRGTKIRPGARFTYPWKVKVGNYSWIGDRTEIYSLGEIVIGDNVAIAQDVSIISGTHDYEDPQFSLIAKPVEIQDESWLAAGSTIMPGVTVRRGSVIGTRALVVSDTDPLGVYVGSPARKTSIRHGSHKRAKTGDVHE